MTTSVQIDDELGEELRRLADKGRTTAAQVVRDAVLQYAERLDAREAFLGEAEAAWQDFEHNGLHLTLDEISAWLNTVGADDEAALPDCHR